MTALIKPLSAPKRLLGFRLKPPWIATKRSCTQAVSVIFKKTASSKGGCGQLSTSILRCCPTPLSESTSLCPNGYWPNSIKPGKPRAPRDQVSLLNWRYVPELVAARKDIRTTTASWPAASGCLTGRRRSPSTPNLIGSTHPGSPQCRPRSPPSHAPWLPMTPQSPAPWQTPAWSLATNLPTHVANPPIR